MDFNEKILHTFKSIDIKLNEKEVQSFKKYIHR